MEKGESEREKEGNLVEKQVFLVEKEQEKLSSIVTSIARLYRNNIVEMQLTKKVVPEESIQLSHELKKALIEELKLLEKEMNLGLKNGIDTDIEETLSQDLLEILMEK